MLLARVWYLSPSLAAFLLSPVIVFCETRRLMFLSLFSDFSVSSAMLLSSFILLGGMGVRSGESGRESSISCSYLSRTRFLKGSNFVLVMIFPLDIYFYICD